VPLFQNAEFPLGVGFCHFYIGLSHQEMNQNEQAISAFEKSIKIWQEIGERDMEMITLSNFGLTCYNWQLYHTAQEYYQKALDIAVELDDQLWECKTTINIGLTYYDRGDQKPALENFQQALIIAQILGDQYQEARALHHIGTAYIELGQYLEALDMLHQALTIREEIDEKDSTGTTLNLHWYCVRHTWASRKGARILSKGFRNPYIN